MPGNNKHFIKIYQVNTCQINESMNEKHASGLCYISQWKTAVVLTWHWSFPRKKGNICSMGQDGIPSVCD